MPSHTVSEMTYTVSSGTLNSSIPYHTILYNIQQAKTLQCIDKTKNNKNVL